MTAIFVPDVSEFQKPVDDSYNREWFIFRVCFGANKVDANARHNLAWAKQAKASGKIKGFTVYVVYLPGANAGILNDLDDLGVPTDCVAMIDAETWRGQPYAISGNHSAELNALAWSLRRRQGDDPELVWGYGNQGDLAELWSNRPDWLGMIVAGYGFKLAHDAVPNMVGQQYTDGLPKFAVDGWPSATPPFGPCDHNIIFQLPETDLPLTDKDAAVVWDHNLTDGDGTTNPASAWVKQARNLAADAKALASDAKAGVASLAKTVAALKAEVDQLKASQTTGGTLHLSGNVSGDLTVS